MSAPENGSSNGNGDNRYSLLGQFSAAHMKEFEIPMDRDFEQTTGAQIQIGDQHQYEVNTFKQNFEIQKDSLGAQNPYVPRYELGHSGAIETKDRYNEIVTRHERNLEQVHVKYSNLIDQTRENGVTLSDEFTASVPEPIETLESSYTNFTELGIETTADFNSSADVDYYGAESAGECYDTSYDYEQNYGSHYEGDFIAPGHDNGNDQGRSR